METCDKVNFDVRLHVASYRITLLVQVIFQLMVHLQNHFICGNLKWQFPDHHEYGFAIYKKSLLQK